MKKHFQVIDTFVMVILAPLTCAWYYGRDLDEKCSIIPFFPISTKHQIRIIKAPPIQVEP